jgi:hypothetical protein
MCVLRLNKIPANVPGKYHSAQALIPSPSPEGRRELDLKVPLPFGDVSRVRASRMLFICLSPSAFILEASLETLIFSIISDDLSHIVREHIIP